MPRLTVVECLKKINEFDDSEGLTIMRKKLKRLQRHSIEAPSYVSNKDPASEPKRKVVRKENKSVHDPFASALLAAKEEAKRRNSKVSVLTSNIAYGILTKT
jgi:hypothetical protein